VNKDNHLRNELLRTQRALMSVPLLIDPTLYPYP